MNQPDSDRSRLAAVAAFAVAVQVGAAIVATRYVVHELGPASLAMFRYTIGALCLAPFVIGRVRMRIALNDIIPIAGFGIVQFGAVISLINIGLRTVPAARASLLFATFPLMTMVVAAAMGRERLTAWKTIGVLVTIAGVAMALPESLSGATHASALGVLAILGAAFCGAACAVFYRPYVRRYSPHLIGLYAMIASVLALMPFAWLESVAARLPGISPGGWVAIVFIGVSSGVGYWLWLWALAHASATRVTVFLGLSPLVAAVLGSLVLAEWPSAPLIGALATVMAGIWLAHRPAET